MQLSVPVLIELLHRLSVTTSRSAVGFDSLVRCPHQRLRYFAGFSPAAQILLDSSCLTAGSASRTPSLHRHYRGFLAGKRQRFRRDTQEVIFARTLRSACRFCHRPSVLRRLLAIRPPWRGCAAHSAARRRARRTPSRPQYRSGTSARSAFRCRRHRRCGRAPPRRA